LGYRPAAAAVRPTGRQGQEGIKGEYFRALYYPQKKRISSQGVVSTSVEAVAPRSRQG